MKLLWMILLLSISWSLKADNVKEDNRLFGRLILMFEAAFRSP